MEEEKKTTTSVETKTTPITPKKKNTVLYIILAIIGFIVLVGIVGAILLGNLVKKGVEVIDDQVDRIERDYEEPDEQSQQDEDEFLFAKSTEETVDGTLESSNLVVDNFDDEIPLSGGKVISSSSRDTYIEVVIEVDSTLQETYDWYIDALREKGWSITGQEVQEPIEGYESASIKFDMDEGRGTISIERVPVYQVSKVTIRELLY